MENQLIPLPPSGNGPLSPSRALVQDELRPFAPAREYRGTPVNPNEGAGLGEYWRIFKRYKGTVIVIAFSGAALGVLLASVQTPIFQARTSVEIQDLNQNVFNIKEMTGEPQAYSALTDIQTQIKILQSDSLAERTISKLKLSSSNGLKLPESRLTVWRRALNLPEPSAADARESDLRDISRSLKVRAAGQTRIIEILVDSTDPKVASNYANTLTNEFIDQALEARWNLTQHLGDWLSRQMDDMRIKLQRSEDGLQSYARENGLLFTGDKEKTNVSEDQLKQLQQVLSTAQADRIAKQSRHEMASSSPAEALPDVLNDPSLRDYQMRITELRRQLADLTTTYTAEHAKVKRVEAQVGAIESAFQRERSAILRRIYNEFQEAQRRETLLAAAYAAQAKIVSGQGEKAIQYGILKREVDTNRQLYEAMLQKVKEASIASAMKASNVRVVDFARPPKHPYKPSLTINSILGLFLGCVIGFAFVIMRDRADRTFQAPGDITYWLRLPELGAIPSAQSASKRRFYYSHRQALAAPSNSTSKQSQVVLTERVELATAQRRNSLLAESFRSLLTSIMFSGENGSRPRLLVMTSSAPSDGKTTVTTNLAIAMAQVGSRVLLIDADMRKPRIHDIFEILNDQGLSTLLEDSALGLESSIADVIHETSIRGLAILPSGPPHPDAATLLYSPRLAELLRYVRKAYDMVIIDTPPMLQMPDARVAARHADGVVLVFRSGQTTRDAALAVLERFTQDNTRVVGTILNDWNPRLSSNGYGGYQNGYYGRDQRQKPAGSDK